MKALIFAVLILLFALPAQAQSHVARVGSAAGPMTNGGGAGAGSFGSLSLPTIARSAPLRYQYTFAQGSEGSFVPSTYVRYEDAVKMGEAALAAQPKPVSIAQVAAQYRALKQHPR
jgi:hypothetical protein